MKKNILKCVAITGVLCTLGGTYYASSMKNYESIEGSVSSDKSSCIGMIESVDLSTIAVKPEPSKEVSHFDRGANTPIRIPIDIELTGYCNCEECSENWGSKTASGSRTREGIVASPKEIPFGTVMEIPGYGEVTVEDRGGAIRLKNDGTYKIDLWKPTHSEANAVGKQHMTAYIIKR